MPRYFALVPAAGAGSRFGGTTPKQYLPIHGRPLLWHAVAALSECPAIERVFVVLHPQDAWFDLQGGWPRNVETLRSGGETRAHSVLNALRAARGTIGDADWVLVHDAARPCITVQLVQALIAAVADDPAGGILALPVADTLKRADASRHVLATQPRDGLWQAQTPQMFRYGTLVDALSAADLASTTDEASAVEGLGLRPKLVPGSTRNIKVTYPDDLKLAELLLREGEGA
jgi:2-C-methyl-D-erythritol 4-phosphate cytidylyltransferase